MGQPELTKCKILQLVIQAKTIYSNIESNWRVLKILDSTYAKSGLDKVATAAVRIYKTQCKKNQVF